MTPFMIYLWLSLDSILSVLEFLVILCGVMLFLYVLYVFDFDEDDRNKSGRSL